MNWFFIMNIDDMDILSPELRDELGNGNDVVIVGRKEKKRS